MARGRYKFSTMLLLLEVLLVRVRVEEMGIEDSCDVIGSEAEHLYSGFSRVHVRSILPFSALRPRCQCGTSLLRIRAEHSGYRRNRSSSVRRPFITRCRFQ